MKRVSKYGFLFCLASLLGVGSGVAFANLYITNKAKPKMYAVEPEYTQEVYPSLEHVPNRYVAIVLGARVWSNGTPSASLRDRLEAARRLYAMGKVKRILVTGDNGQASYNEVAVMHQWLVKRGVPKKDVFTDHAGFRTHDSMQRAAKVFDVKDAIVCTQAFHLPRSLFLAREAGIDAVGVIADARRYSVRRKNKVREMVARTVALGDVWVWRRQPKFLGKKIPITGDAARSYDESIKVKPS